MRPRVVVILVAALIGSGFPFAASTAEPTQIVDEGFIPAGTQGVLGRQGVRMMERADYKETASVLRARDNGRIKSCTSLNDSPCKGWNDIEFTAILQPCATSSDLNCVVEFGVVRTDGAKIAARFERKFPSEAWNKYPADSSAGLPAGETGGLWVVPEIAGLPVSLHYVRASVQGRINGEGKAEFENFAASLTPVSMVSMFCSQNQGWKTGPYPCTSGDFQTNRDEPGYWGFVEGSGSDQNLDCEMSGNANYAAETAECAVRKPALLDTKYYLSVRLAQSPQGWLHGRLASADVSITSVSSSKGAIILSISGKSVRVPVVFKEAPFTSLPSALQEKYRGTGGWPSATGLGAASNWGLKDTNSADPAGRNRMSIPTSYGPDGIEELEAWMPYLNDTSAADRATWSLRTLSAWERGEANSCLTDKTKVTGLVFTNATQYLAGAPAYNSQTKTLDYKVAAPHFMSNGDVFKGSYQLIVRSDVAKCIYNFSSTNVSATVKVVEASGATASAVTSVLIKDGWVILMATGYSHSSPTIRATFIANSSKTALKVGVRKTIKSSTIAKAAGLVMSKTSRVTLMVAVKSKKFCRVERSVLRGLKRGACSLTVRVSTGKKISRKTLSVAVS